MGEHTMMFRLQHLSWMLLVSPIFGGLMLPDLGNLSDKDMEDLVYSLLADSNPGSNEMNMNTRAWDYVDNMYRRSPMQLDHSNPTTRLFTDNPYHKRSASLFSGLNSRLKNQAFSDGLYKRSADEEEEDIEGPVDKRSASLFSGMNSRLNNGKFLNELYKRSASLFSGMNSRMNNGQFLNGLYKRSASMFSGMNSRLNNGAFIDGLYK